MARPPATTEQRTLQALREARAITGPELDAALAALTATVACTRCGGDGQHEGDGWPGCNRCQGTGEEYVIR
jgi:DnaJ-class molecular chaperone